MMRRPCTFLPLTAMTMHKYNLLALLLLGLTAAMPARAQISVHPTGVNVNAQGATVVFLTFGGLGSYQPVDAQWCGDLIDARPDVGQRCNPATLFGSLPLRSNLGVPSGTGGFTDIMSIPPSVTRRAYQEAERGAASQFFYVRHFAGPAGTPDVYVAVTCRLAGGGARVPFALLDVQVQFGADVPVLAAEPGQPLPPLYAEIAYNGTGQLRGRWEVVRPGEEPPAQRDLLTEATLPIEERSLQRRYTELERFSMFLPPSTRRFRLPGPDPARLPTDVDGLYQILLRIEATDDKEGDSNLASAGAGQGVVHSGAVAGFPLPVLRYYVGVDGNDLVAPVPGVLYALYPITDAAFAPEAAVDFSWTEVVQAALYRVAVRDGMEMRVLEAVVPASLNTYRAPPWLAERATDGTIQWRVEALDFGGNLIGRTPWRSLHFSPENRHR